MGAAVAVIMRMPLNKLDAGDVAYQALGISGALAVIFAGWSTSNPTLYRAGLALQAITPGWPRWVVTLLAGIFTTAVACFPFVFTNLLDFVGLYGILLMPVGTIVVVEHFLFPRIGLTRYWFSGTGRVMNWPVLVTWFGAVGLACYLHFARILHLFFLPLPIWILVAVVYTLLAAMAGARGSVPIASASEPRSPRSAPNEAPQTSPADSPTPWLIRAVGIIALLALLACVLLPITVLSGNWAPYAERLANYRTWLTWATVVHLVACATWILAKNK
jgi:NCS1 family nucleobase:cation symporter-1